MCNTIKIPVMDEHQTDFFFKHIVKIHVYPKAKLCPDIAYTPILYYDGIYITKPDIRNLKLSYGIVENHMIFEIGLKPFCSSIPIYQGFNSKSEMCKWKLKNE